ncbi:peroxisomal targeting signal 2 receptor-like [Gigantopelta aegis]|uniref:peroxisomal targeting signal 2 receptor-like n=1 Tax=Gigantopelta aegis TaxID=1735272 RepID=UPI001B88AFE4|nr:peroxisomal targeting signal 2 receptor-like [Gigantopelta aegis]XP_041348763.1 peroxisomal targeting signal 2 receptor-like [Gigantopelta aegis]XP_041348764.1 peroxisomal targeting signal 2 receptor-like [Gigantopelta aegis]
MDGHRFRVFSAKYNVNYPNTFITGGWDNSVQYWDDRQPHAFNKFSGPHVCGDAIDIETYSDTIVTGSWRKDNVIQIWDFLSAKKLMDVPQDKRHQSQLYCIQWLNKEHVVGGGSSENLVHIIDLRSQNTIGQIYNLAQGVFCIDIEHQLKNPRIAIGSGHFVYFVRC